MRLSAFAVIALAATLAAQTGQQPSSSASQAPKGAPEKEATQAPKPKPPKEEQSSKTATKKAAAPAGGVKELKGLDVTLMDKTADPCNDFYQYSCGGWVKANPVPGDQSSYGRDTELAERNRIILRNILEKAAKNPGASPDSQKIGEYYGACMDEAAVEKKGPAAIKP